MRHPLPFALLAALFVVGCDNLPVDGTPIDEGPVVFGEPIIAAPYTWRWIDFPDSACADGSASGIGVNLVPGATKAFVYFEGGGACWSYENCFTVPTSFHLNGFTQRDFEGLLVGTYLNSTLFDRDDARNPLADAHHVFVPYCTGDVFMGRRIAEFEGGPFGLINRTMHFYGALNVEAFLRRLAPTFEGVDHVVLSGSSAGGFGAAFNWWKVKEFFPAARVDVLDDSGPPIDPAGGNWVSWLDVWGVQLPDGCDDCDQSVRNVMRFARETVADQGRFGLMSYRRDAVISTFFGLSPFDFEARLMQFVEDNANEPNINAFVVPGILHTFLILGFDRIEAENNLPLWRWVEQMIDGDPDWTSVTR